MRIDLVIRMLDFVSGTSFCRGRGCALVECVTDVIMYQLECA
jgi:hypothetical protein